MIQRGQIRRVHGDCARACVHTCVYMCVLVYVASSLRVHGQASLVLVLAILPIHCKPPNSIILERGGPPAKC